MNTNIKHKKLEMTLDYKLSKQLKKKVYVLSKEIQKSNASA